jgi:biotin transporter BioY
MSNADMWALIVGFFVPPIESIIQQPTWPRWFKSIVMFVVSIVVGMGTMYFAGTLQFGTYTERKDLITVILLVMVTTITTYNGLWKPTTIAPKIEQATSPTK